MDLGVIQARPTHFLQSTAQGNQRIPEREGITVKGIDSRSQRSIPVSLEGQLGHFRQVTLLLL